VATLEICPIDVVEAADCGLVHGLLELESLHDLIAHPVAGASYEGLVLENLIGAAGVRRLPYFYRTQDGAEIDLVLARGGTPEIAIEVKRSSAPSPDKGFAIACDDLGISRRYLVYPGQERFSLRHGAEAISLPDLMALLREGDGRITAD